MHYVVATIALAALAIADPLPDVQYGKRAGSGSPAGCSPNYQGKFSVSQVNVSSSSSKRTLHSRDEPLSMMLHNGKLTDSKGHTGYIASNNQFQFDGPPQAGALYTSGFSVCANGSLALHSAVWYSCLSGDFYNLYDYNKAPQCFEVYLEVVGSGGATPAKTPDSYEPAETTSAPVGYTGAGATSAAAAATGSATTATAGGGSSECSQIGDGQAQCITPTTTPSCGEGGDGQPQCSSAGAAATLPPAPLTTATSAPSAACGVMGDGQPNCSPTYTGPPIPPAPNAASAFSAHHELFGLAAGLLALAVF